MTFRQELKKRKKEQAFKEFDYQATMGDINSPTLQGYADRFGMTVSSLSKWRIEWTKKRKGGD